MNFKQMILGATEMVDLEPRASEEIFRDLGRGKRTFAIGCTGGKGLCRPGGEDRLQQLKKELELRGFPVTGTFVVDALCNKGLDELSLLCQFRQIRQSDLLLVNSCAVGVQALAAIVEQRVVPAMRTLAVEGFQGVFGEKEPCRLCGDCLLDLSGGLCPLYFCPKSLLNGPCQGASHGLCEVDPQKPCGWELIYERLKAEGRLEALKHRGEPKDHSERLPLLRLRSSPHIQKN
jgi:hypothetical protein